MPSFFLTWNSALDRRFISFVRFCIIVTVLFPAHTALQYQSAKPVFMKEWMI